jgi:hypothetical protein
MIYLNIFLIVVSAYVLFIGYRFIKPHIGKLWYNTFIIFLGLSVILFFLIELFTINPRPGSVSGNGNLGLIILIFLVPIFLFWLWIWCRSVYKGLLQESVPNLNIHLINGLVFLLIGTVLQFYFVTSKLKTLANHPYNPFEKGYRGSIVNQYTNTLFFNGSIFGILVSGLLVGTLLLLKYKKEKQQQNYKS